MSAVGRYEKCVLGLTALFLVVCGGYYAGVRSSARPYRVTADTASAASSAVSQPEEGRPESLLPGEILNLNTAAPGDLERLPGIGPNRAQAIRMWREEHGPFQSVDQVVEVPGIGPGILEDIRPYVCVE